MMPTRRSQRPSTAERLYALWLHLYPRAHRRDFGPLMLQTFVDSYRDAMATQGRVGARFWLDVIRDEATSLVREHQAALSEDGGRRKRWGMAAASGLLLIASMLVLLALCLL